MQITNASENVLAVNTNRANVLFRVRLSEVEPALAEKIATIQHMSDEQDMTDAEIAEVLGLSKSWVGMLRRDVTFFFYCGACGAQVAKKHAGCRVCGNNADDALRAEVVLN